MGLTNFRGTKPRKQDVTIAKNYLNKQELSALNNLAGIPHQIFAYRAF